MTTPHVPPDWAFEFHGHLCPFMPPGYRMGRLAMEHLGVERERDHGFFVLPENREGHPQTWTAVASIAGALVDSWLMQRRLQAAQVKTTIGVPLIFIAATMAYKLLG